jgi:predicted oxidoreductase
VKEEIDMKMNRRTFLAGAGLIGLSATGGALSLAGCDNNQPPSASEPTMNADLPLASEADPIPPAAPPESWDKEADVVVVGTGGGGLAATTLAAESGAKVIAVEKSNVVGGATRHGAVFVSLTGGSKQQDAVGYPYDPRGLVNTYNQLCQYTLDDKVQLALVKDAGECVDWMQAHDGVNWFFAEPIAWVDKDIAEGKQNNVLGMNNTVNAMEVSAVKAGAEILTLCKCEQLVMENDTVVGIRAHDTSTDEDVYIKASKGVILCAGGIGMNQDLLKQYIPTAYRCAAQGGPMPNDTGDAFRMGLGAGADVSGYDSWSCWEGTLDDYWGDGDGQYWHYFWNGSRQAVQNAWLLLDKRGERVPYYALGVQPTFDNYVNYFSANLTQMGDQSTISAVMSRIGHRAYAFFDADFATNIFDHKLYYADHPDASRKPITSEDPLLPNSFVTNDWLAEFEEAVNRGAIKKADTIEDLATQLGLKPEKIKAGVERWNELCAQGEDTDLIVPYAKEWLVPIEKAPYYGVALSGQIGKTFCGLRIDDHFRVVNTDGDPISGLYANFFTAGGANGESNYGSIYGNGAIFCGVGTTWISGYAACKNLLQDTK